SFASLMRRTNPDLTLLSYANATLAEPGNVTDLPEAAFAHDDSGARITATGFGTYLMESSFEPWRQMATEQCDERVARAGYDGCLVDMLTLGIFARGIVSAPPQDPATGQTYTEVAYRDQMLALAAAYRERSPSLIHIGNSVENAYRYWEAGEATSQPLVTSQPGAQMEDFLRGAGDDVTDFPSPSQWLLNVRVIEDMQDRGTVGLFTTKLWVPAGRAQVARWQAYAMATFLMGADGGSYFAFTRSRDQVGVLNLNAPYRMPRTIGRSTGPRTRLASGAWIRRFARGRAVVNPTGRADTVRLGRPWRTLDGRVTRTLRLPARSGDVVVVPTRR
ncbi:MAG: putative glycoside hydrolase, partial [Solirubrobacteraceae bacterium]|nr:putative glycoside hydrolase [Solirubrobacteraceae bacterium]